ncbi:MAG TPA: TIGR03619 family F420-dependent LLM class oxidoreductase [Streptosporangiaceae bacterium]|nr:TIGR03619 family F420-dependent LLM class oxidoreductase [Streptosporangiaceae bacterium]
MKFGLYYNTALYGTDPDLMVAVARHAQECGFESFYMSEHIVVYPGATIPGYVSLPPDLAVADPLDCLAYVAAATSTLLLGTAVLLLPYHHPVVLAKRLATIDLLSRGRMSLLTVGLGVLPGEAAAVGVDFTTRGRRADEAIDVLRLLWGGDAAGVSFQGEFFSLSEVCSFPKPHGGRTLPIHVGGSSVPAARRAGRRGDGYFPGGRLTLEQRIEQIAIMRAEAVTAGRDPAALEYTRWGQVDMTADEVQALASQGVTRLLVGPGASAELADMQDEMSSLARRLQFG